MHNVQITFVIVCRNDLKNLKITYNNLINQSSRNYEIVIVDGNSFDGTKKFLKDLKIAPNIRWLSEPDLGIYNAMNKGILLAKGTFINFLNAGDTLLSYDMVEKINMILDQRFEQIVFGYQHGVNFYKGNVNYRFLIRGMTCHQAIFYKSTFLKAFKFNEVYTLVADFDHLINSMNNSNILTLEMPIVRYDTSGISSQRNMRPILLAERYKSILNSRLSIFFKVIFIIYNRFSYLKFKWQRL